jgi:DNA-binding Lrp family transcriptional regulator
MDATDRRLLNRIQKAFPTVPDPYAVLAREFGLEPEEARRRIERMRASGLIRRIGAVFDPRRLGFASTLCAAAVPVEGIDDFVKTVNAYEGVTHNYRRNDTHNIWFTAIAPSEEALAAMVEEIRARTGISDILCLRARRRFKVDAAFRV